MELLDSRRLTGATILWERPGAVIDIDTRGVDRDALIEAWSAAARRLLDALGWAQEETRVRTFENGASLALSAPLDALYAATELNECAWAFACAQLTGERPPDFDEELERLRGELRSEANPRLLALQAEAAERGLAFLSDDDLVSVGLGCGSQTWPVSELPSIDEVDWSQRHDIPTVLITGTNGKTTTARLLAAIVEASGRVPGITSTDRVRIGTDVIESGDWSGPGGARLVLRDTRTELGILETARGGMMRRGLALTHCDVAALLNVGADHLGEWGVGNLDGLAEAKFVVTSVAERVVLNADDEVVVRHAAGLDKQVTWFGLDCENPLLQQHLECGGTACVLDEGVLWLRSGNSGQRILAAEELPCSLGGASRYNLANALAAAALAHALGLELEAIRQGLRSFTNSREENPGRLNVFEFGDLRAIVDFAHNPHGLAATMEMARALPAERLLVLLGQAGDRDEASIREMVRTTWAGEPDMVVIKELTEHLRGRPAGEVPALIEEELRAAGASAAHFVRCASELEAVHWALDWAKPGDLLLLLVHDVRDEVLALLDDLTQRGWRPGDPRPSKS